MKKPKLRIFLHHPECSAQSGSGIYEALSKDFNAGFFQVQDITESYFKKVDIVVFPGGIGDSDSYDKILRPREDVIKNFVHRGGRYLGVCMGAYWTGHHYFDIIDSAKVVQYIKQPTAEIRRSYSTVAEVNWLDQNYNMFFYDGCCIKGDQNKFTTVARYANSDPMAVIQDNIGIIGCHPESTKSWYNYRYLRNHWHHYKHHELLNKFTKQLV